MVNQLEAESQNEHAQEVISENRTTEGTILYFLQWLSSHLQYSL